MIKKMNKNKLLQVFAVFAGLALTMSLHSTSFAQEYEYEADEGLHQEEWYDPSDWFTTGGGVDYESDWNDFYYGYDYYDPWYELQSNYGVSPYYNDPMFDYDPYGYNYYTEDWYDPTFDTWYEGNTKETTTK